MTAILEKVKLNNPIPFESLAAECQKCSSILDHFIKGNNKVDATLIPPKIIENAKGVAVVTVIKAGFVWTGKIGSGLVVAKLADGRWSAPSSVALTGVGFGAQIGAQLTDFVFILNTYDAVKAFSHGGNVTLGAQIGVAAGPVGRAVEGAGTIMNPAPIYAYSKNKGLFAGISLEGSVVMTRNDANAHFYNRKVTARELLSGEVDPPVIAETLYRSLNVRFGSFSAGATAAGGTYYGTSSLDRPSQNYSSSAGADRHQTGTASLDRYNTTTNSYKAPPAPPRNAGNSETTATALYDFAGERPADLSFKKGDLIVILKSTASTNDWWTGRVGSNEGVCT
ncbi:hypothetical protein BJ742DRAFT_679733 [Cladochytrium replicatum]|nr:hypothetical protein BJ742DRAFT_679733 [Cladochytrium replicatum]